MKTGSIREINWQAACDALHIVVGHDCFGVEAAVALERYFKEVLKAELTGVRHTKAGPPVRQIRDPHDPYRTRTPDCWCLPLSRFWTLFSGIPIVMEGRGACGRRLVRWSTRSVVLGKPAVARRESSTNPQPWFGPVGADP